MFYIYKCKQILKKMKESVGILIIAKDTNNYLLLHRVEKPISWSILTGKMDVEGETPLQTVKREIQEEIQDFEVEVNTYDKKNNLTR